MMNKAITNKGGGVKYSQPCGRVSVGNTSKTKRARALLREIDRIKYGICGYRYK